MREKPVSMRFIDTSRVNGLQRETAAVKGAASPSSPKYLKFRQGKQVSGLLVSMLAIHMPHSSNQMGSKTRSHGIGQYEK